MDFFERVKELARLKNTTIASVAKEAGLSLDTYNTMRKRGNLPRLNEALKIADYLGTTVEYLVGRLARNGVSQRCDELMQYIMLLPEEKVEDIIMVVKTLSAKEQKKRDYGNQPTMGSAV